MIPPLLPIFIWPLVCLFFFKRYSPAVAISLTIIGGHLLLPATVSFDLPVLPALSKTTVPGLTAFLIGAAILKSREREFPPGSIRPGWLPKDKLMLTLFIGTLLASFMTVLTNQDRLVYGATAIPGLRIYDGFSLSLRLFVQMLPLLLARKYLARPEDHRTLLVVIGVAGLVYTLPTLVEVRLSPQINIWVYGFFAHDWFQHVRGGHFRPLVFLAHGLYLGIFLAGAVIAMAAYLRLENVSRTKAIFAVLWLIVVLFLARTLGAFLITLLLLPLALMLKVRTQMICMGVLGLFVLLYPMFRGADLVPVDRAVSLAERVNPERAQSLWFRFKNEDILLEKANQRPIFGWGSWGRNRVYDETGRDISVTDGSWIIIMGSDGWVGYIGKFGLLTLPIILLAFSRRRGEVTLATSGLCLVLMVNLLDMLPNSSLTMLSWLMAGALVGRLELRREELDADDTSAAPVQVGRRRPAYSRPRPAHVVADRPSDTPSDGPRYARRKPTTSRA